MALQPGDIQNLSEAESVDYLIQRGVNKKDAHELFQVDCPRCLLTCVWLIQQPYT